MAIRCQKRIISFLSGYLPYFAVGKRVNGALALKVPGLILNFPHFVAFPKSIRELLGWSIAWLLALTFLWQLRL